MRCFTGILCCSLCLIFLACSSDNKDCEPGPVQTPNQQAEIDPASYKQSMLDCRLSKVQTFQVNNDSFSQLVAKHGTILTINPLTFSQPDGTPIVGEVTISLLEMYQPGEIIASQLSTNGLNSMKKVEPLLSEGIFFLNVTYNDQPVNFNRDIQLFIPSENKNLELSLFNSPSCPELGCKVLWENKLGASISNEPFMDAVGNTILGYRVFFRATGWLNLARYNNSKETRGTLYNKAPEGYTTANSTTFLTYDSPSIAVGMFSTFDTENGVFCEKYGEIPNNTKGNVIFVSKPETKFKFGSEAVTTKDGKITVTRDLQSGSENTLIDYINNL